MLQSHILVGLLLFCCVDRSQAEPASWPRTVTVTVGDLRTKIEAEKMWTLSGIDYQGQMLATPDSAYGTVLTIRNVGHLGTAHFLDVPGKPGQIEKENVASLTFMIDNKPVTQFSPNMELKGKQFRMTRVSTIRTIAVESSVTLQDDMLIEQARLSASGEMDLVKAHPLMYALTPAATHYVIGDETGVVRRGEFLKEGKTGNDVFASPRWIAVFDSVAQRGAVCVLDSPQDKKCSFLLVDAPGVYRKFALYTQVDQVITRGFAATYTCGVTGFKSSSSNWEAVAVKRAGEVAHRMRNK